MMTEKLSRAPAAAPGKIRPAPVADDAATFGQCIGGLLPGPTVVVVGHDRLADCVFARLQKLPSLRWLRGTLLLVSLKDLDALPPGQPLRAASGTVDEILFLTQAPVDGHLNEAVRQSYWSVLRLCARLGMIAGRGLPSAH